MYSLFTALTVLFPTTTATTMFAGDSVIITVALIDNAAPQPVSVDSVGFFIDRTGCLSCQKTLTVAKQAGTTTARFAYPLSSWAPNETKTGPVKVRLAHVEAPVTAWTAYTQLATGWSFTRAVPTPAVPDANAISVPTVVLN